MEYKLQLQQGEWFSKRQEVLKRDSNRCINCLNQSYQHTFSSGLIFGNGIKEVVPNTVFRNGKFIVRIWDMKQNRIQNAFVEPEHFNPERSYVAFYEHSPTYINIVGLKYINNDLIELSPSVLDIARLGIRGRVSERTNSIICEPISAEDIWGFVKGLHIHHTYYQEGKLAWQYESSSLQTLCWMCHEQLHKDKTVPVWDLEGNEVGRYTNCKRCAGAGYFPEFRHVYSGICFRCDGNRFEELRPVEE